MKKVISAFAALLLLCGLFSGCTRETPESTTPQTPTRSDDELFTDRDYETQYDGGIEIQLQGSTAASTSNAVSIDRSTVTITKEGTYILSGTLEDGTVIIDAGEQDKLQLVFDGVSIHSEATAALNIQGADKVFLTLAPGSENALSSDSFTDDVDATLFSRQDLTINGSGSLSITSPAGHGIACKDDLVITGGSCSVTSASHGLDVNDSVRITGDTTLTLNAGQDGIHCENADDATLGFVYISKGTVNVEAQGDAISAGAYAQIRDGSFTLTAGGGSVNGSKEASDSFGGFMGGGRPRPRTAVATEDATSMKGLKSAGEILISGGSFTVDAADDAIHADGSATVSGGTFDIKTGDDAFHAEDSLTVTGGKVNIRESYEGLEAQTVTVSGGELLINATDDGLNAADGTDESGMTGGRDGMFGGGRPGQGGFMGGTSSFDGSIGISGGKLAIYSSGDGMDANGGIAISGGEIYIANPSSGDTSVIDSETGAVITGGRFISSGASMMMAQSFASSSTQGVIACTVGSQAAGATVTVTDAQGNILISYEIEYPSVLVIISTPEIIKGESYTITVGEASGTVQAE